MVCIVYDTPQRLQKNGPHSFLLGSFLLLYLLWFLWISLPLSFFLLKTVSALLLLHQKAVAKWRLTSAAATEEGLCVFSSWGQIPLKRAKLCISHCNENPLPRQTNLPFSITHFALFIKNYSSDTQENKVGIILEEPTPLNFSFTSWQPVLFFSLIAPPQHKHNTETPVHNRPGLCSNNCVL